MTAADGKVQLVAGLTKDLIDRGLHAGNWLKEVAPVVGGGGGGKPDMAQAGGKLPDQIPAALDRAVEALSAQLSR
jgi:alanyl-tRNA synthetase